ncbi:hypothetical protein DITRI_Ditri20bG0035500 [Diplodiscus trichospermus]
MAMDCFSEFIENLGLIDLPLIEGKFTWSSNRTTPTCSRLDRFLLAAEFVSKFPNLRQKVGPKSLSDHNLILLEVEEVNWGPKPFKFFNYWMEEDGYSQLIEDQWGKLQVTMAGSNNLWKKFRSLKEAIKEWHKLKENNESAKITEMEKEIQDFEDMYESERDWQNTRNTIVTKKEELWVLYRVEER